MLERSATGARHPIVSKERPSPAAAVDLAACVAQASRATMVLLALPFDAVRVAYACAVNARIVRRSMLANRDFERALGALERLALGLWARRV